MAEEPTEKFAGTSGRVTGVVGLLVVAVAAAVGIIDRSADYHPAAYVILGLVAVLLWACLLRPGVSVVGDRLVLRNMFDTVSIPLAAIEQVAVRQYLAVGVAGHRYTNAGIGRSRRQGLRDDRRDPDKQPSYGGFVESRILKLAEDARDAHGVALMSEEQEALAEGVRRTWAWAEIGLLAALGLALVVTLLL